MVFLRNKDNIISTVTLIIVLIIVSIKFFNEREIDIYTKNNLNKFENNLNQTLLDFKYHQLFNLELNKYDGELINDLKYKYPITSQSTHYIKEKLNNLRNKEKITFNDIKYLTELINKKYEYDLKRNNIAIK